MRIEELTFESEGTACAATLYLPDQTTKHPAVVLSHGFGAVRGMRNIPEVATALAEQGIVALAFDYRYLGESQGMPRQQVLPYAQREDIRNALSFLETLEYVDGERLGLWGTSFSAGQSVRVTAFDRRVKALVCQVPAMDLFRQIQFDAPTEQREMLMEAIAGERLNHFENKEPRTLRLAAPEGEDSVFGPPSLEWAEHNEREHASFFNEVTISSLEQALQTAPGDYIELVSPTPLLVIIAEPDGTVVVERTLAAYERAKQPKELLRIQGEHYDAYDVPTTLEKATSAAIKWFNRHLKP